MTSRWSPQSWREKPVVQMPTDYPDKAALSAVEDELAAMPPLVFAADAAPFELDDRAFLPHLTLGRVKMDGEGIDWPKIFNAVEVRHVSSVVDRVTLYRSQLSQFGPHYTGLVSAPLIGTSK